ncbi:MAG: hypothetical protein HeimC3_22230 [Candidatus Heimdallarchaeota archaeon LC_3]|nr:MAG: hypothetical protein HeimC3_22230 [Candidatus Heimdallarchaeota archaeon LC_3]
MLEVIHDPNKFIKKGRLDRWWIQPLGVATVLVTFIIYTNLAIFIQDGFKHTEGAFYVSPIYSPELKFDWWPHALSPAFILIWIPLGFRATCYYMRRVYYRTFFLDPVACAVKDIKPIRLDYKGEKRFPFILNNLHRYFLYGAIVLMVIHWFDAINAMQFGSKIGIGIGTVLIALDAIFLTAYVFSCHSFRHLIGGNTNQYSKGIINKIRYRAWSLSSKLNPHHNVYFWLSAISVMVADFYIRLLALGILDPALDLRLLF